MHRLAVCLFWPKTPHCRSWPVHYFLPDLSLRATFLLIPAEIPTVPLLPAFLWLARLHLLPTWILAGLDDFSCTFWHCFPAFSSTFFVLFSGCAILPTLFTWALFACSGVITYCTTLEFAFKMGSFSQLCCLPISIFLLGRISLAYLRGERHTFDFCIQVSDSFFLLSDIISYPHFCCATYIAARVATQQYSSHHPTDTLL